MNLKRIQELIQGDEPEDTAEWAFVNSYVKASVGEPLINICIDGKNEIDYYGEDEYQYFILGYAMGQKDFLDKLDGLDLDKIKKDDDEPLH